MSYTAFYRKWRPQNFEEVRGQEAVVTTLRNQLNSGRVGHAYLFCGTRGTGKTTIAKIFARAVNCENPQNGSPCNECPTCKAILSGASMNVSEIDAASNNGVDNIREIRDEVKYSPTEGKYRVYIIDEVHMLSAGAYNALLKTLEEPPAYVIFILATTEVHKIPITVLSRCQRYDFKRITSETIFDQLKKLTTTEGIAAEEAALRYIARAADGALRDALSILEQCVAFHYGETLTYEQVLEVVGATDTEVFGSLLDALVQKDVEASLKLLDDICFSGRDLSQFTVDFVWYLRNLLMLQTNSVTEDDLGVSPDQMPMLKKQALSLSMQELTTYIRHFSALNNTMRYATDKRVILEVEVLRMMYPEMIPEDIEMLRLRVETLEQQLSALAGGNTDELAKLMSSEAVINQTVAGREEPKEVRTVTLSEEAVVDWETFQKNWRSICQKSGRFIDSQIKFAGRPSCKDGDQFGVAFSNPNSFRLMNDPERIQRLSDAASEVLGKSMTLFVELASDVIEVKKGTRRMADPKDVSDIEDIHWPPRADQQ